MPGSGSIPIGIRCRNNVRPRSCRGGFAENSSFDMKEGCAESPWRLQGDISNEMKLLTKT